MEKNHLKANGYANAWYIKPSKTEFKSVSDYVAFVLREVLRDIEEDEEEKQGFTKEEEESVKKRLKAVGYLD